MISNEVMTTEDLVKGSFNCYGFSISAGEIELYINHFQSIDHNLVAAAIYDHVRSEPNLPPYAEAIQKRIESIIVHTNYNLH